MLTNRYKKKRLGKPQFVVASKLQLFHAIFGSEDSDTEPEGDSNVSGSTKSKKLQKKPKVNYLQCIRTKELQSKENSTLCLNQY